MPEIIFRFVLPLYGVRVVVGLLVVQARLEEEFLAVRHGEAYAEYRQNTRRF